MAQGRCLAAPVNLSHVLDLLLITADPVLAAECDAVPGMRLFVDLERLGKAERQAGRNTFISTHQIGDVARVKAAVKCTPVMVRVNPLGSHTADEVEAVLARGADMLMLPMFRTAAEVRGFCEVIGGRAPVVALLETRDALESVEEWIGTPGLVEIFVGLNDLHISMGLAFMFEPLALGLIDHVAELARGAGRRFGFGGVARMDEGLLPGRDVLAEHERLGSAAVILSRTFHRRDSPRSLATEVRVLREMEGVLAGRDDATRALDRLRISGTIEQISASMKPVTQ